MRAVRWWPQGSSGRPHKQVRTMRGGTETTQKDYAKHLGFHLRDATRWVRGPNEASTCALEIGSEPSHPPQLA